MACALSSFALQCSLDDFELIDDDRLFIEQIFSLQAEAQPGEGYAFFDDEDLFMTFEAAELALQPDFAAPGAEDFFGELEHPPGMPTAPEPSTVDGQECQDEERLVYDGHSPSRMFPVLKACQSVDRKRGSSDTLSSSSRDSSSAPERRDSGTGYTPPGRSSGEREKTADQRKHLGDDSLKRRRNGRVGADITNVDSKRQNCGVRKGVVWDHRKIGQQMAAKENAYVKVEAVALKKPPPVVDLSHKYLVSSQEPEPPAKSSEETDPQRLSQRQKQIDYGKNTLGYERYLQQVPKHRRRMDQPSTPKLRQVCSKRSFDGQIKKWRRQLHAYDSQGETNEDLNEEELGP